MPCMKCKNGKWKYGAKGKPIYPTKAKCEEARKAIHAKKKGK